MKTELRKVGKSALSVAQAQAARNEAIREAHAAGISIRVIADEAGLSSARVHQILHGR